MAELTDLERLLVGAIAAICCSGGKALRQPSIFGPGLARATRMLKGANTAADVKGGLEALTAAMGEAGAPPFCNPEGPEDA